MQAKWTDSGCAHQRFWEVLKNVPKLPPTPNPANTQHTVSTPSPIVAFYKNRSNPPLDSTCLPLFFTCFLFGPKKTTPPKNFFRFLQVTNSKAKAFKMRSPKDWVAANHRHPMYVSKIATKLLREMGEKKASKREGVGWFRVFRGRWVGFRVWRMKFIVLVFNVFGFVSVLWSDMYLNFVCSYFLL